MMRIGLIGGMSWESTSSYYALLNQLTSDKLGAWHQPKVLIDSLDFHEIAALQAVDDWDATGELLVDSARRLERAGATVLAITANTMHMNYDQVNNSVSVPVIDIRDAIVGQLKERGATSLSLLGTRYVMEKDFFAARLRAKGVQVVVPEGEAIEDLHRIIFNELTRGIILESSRERFIDIADECRQRGGDVVGLCCTEFGMLINAEDAPWPSINSTTAHVRALLSFEDA